MNKKLKITLICLFGFVTAVLLFFIFVPPPQHKLTPEQQKQILDSYLHKKIQRSYRQLILALYEPPAEAFTPAGYNLLKQIQGSYSPLFIPYLIRGSTIVQPDVFWNPFFDMYILVGDKDGLIDSITLASSLTGGQTPQRDVQVNFWKEIYQRYQTALIASFSSITPYKDLSYPILQIRNLTNNYIWPKRIPISKAKTPFDLYIQQEDQAIYCTPVEPGAYIIFNISDGKLHTNMLCLPPFVVQNMRDVLQSQIQEKQNQLANKKAN